MFPDTTTARPRPCRFPGKISMIPAKTPSRRQSKMLSKQRTARGGPGEGGGWNTNQHHTLYLLVRTSFVGYIVFFGSVACCVMGLDAVHVIVGVGSAGW